MRAGEVAESRLASNRAGQAVWPTRQATLTMTTTTTGTAIRICVGNFEHERPAQVRQRRGRENQSQRCSMLGAVACHVDGMSM
eukprot:1464254-Prymnesium_polylepis.2